MCKYTHEKYQKNLATSVFRYKPHIFRRKTYVRKNYELQSSIFLYSAEKNCENTKNLHCVESNKINIGYYNVISKKRSKKVCEFAYYIYIRIL